MWSALRLFLILIWAFIPQAVAQTLKIEDWPQWNARSSPVFPAARWLRYAVPEDAGWSSEALAGARKASLSAGSAAVMVIYDGAVLAEWGETDRRFFCHSIRKSLLSALYGAAVSAGRIDVNAAIGSLGIDDHAGLTRQEKSATIADLLKSRSGVYLPSALQPVTPNTVRPNRGSKKPGSYWYYNNWDFNVLGTIYNQQTGDDLFEAFAAQIAAPLQMQDFARQQTRYVLLPEKSRHPAYVFRMSSRDLARFGLLMLHKGRWRQQQIIPADWVRQSTRQYSITPAGGYGYMWWREVGQLDQLDTFTAYGYGGHAVYVVPGAKLVMVHRTDTYTGRKVSYSAVRRILRQILNARQGPPLRNPQLQPRPAGRAVPSASSGADMPLPVSGQVLTGRYRGKTLTLTVRKIGNRLEIDSPRQGRFYLDPIGASSFVMEDSRWRVDFDLSSGGAAEKLQVRLLPGPDIYAFRRLP